MTYMKGGLVALWTVNLGVEAWFNALLCDGKLPTTIDYEDCSMESWW